MSEQDQPSPWTYQGRELTEDDLVGSSLVYWIFDETCHDPMTDGYVGITRNLERRLNQHKKSKKFPENFSSKVLFNGTPDECNLMENLLRPKWNIGWNSAPGGNFGFIKGGEPLPDNVKKKLSERGKASWTQERRKRHSDKLKGNQNAKGGKGKPKSEEHKLKIKESVTRARKEHPARPWTDEERRARSLMMKKIWRDKREAAGMDV